MFYYKMFWLNIWCIHKKKNPVKYSFIDWVSNLKFYRMFTKYSTLLVIYINIPWYLADKIVSRKWHTMPALHLLPVVFLKREIWLSIYLVLGGIHVIKQIFTQSKVGVPGCSLCTRIFGKILFKNLYHIRIHISESDNLSKIPPHSGTEFLHFLIKFVHTIIYLLLLDHT